MSAPRILLVSNGFGEISIAECIARAIAAEDPNAVLAHMPLVGRLAPDAWPKPVGPQADMPSGGLVAYWNLRNIWRDVRAGLIAGTIRQYVYLSRRRDAFDAVVAVGDVYCLAACLLFARRPTIFVATAKSEYVAPHSVLECAIAKRARLTFARDAATAAALSRRGVRATYAGNVMMDGVADTELELPVNSGAMRFSILPGSRADAPANAGFAARRLKRIAEIASDQVQAFVAVAPSVSSAQIAGALGSEGVEMALTGTNAGVVGRGRAGRLEVLLVRGGFGAVLRAADVVLGQAGTGNEQAAGLGKPVIAAADPGETPTNMGWYRMRQKRLLGNALMVLPADDEQFARGVLRIVGDRAAMGVMSAAGRERMGAAGGAAAVADAALSLAKTQ